MNANKSKQHIFYCVLIFVMLACFVAGMSTYSFVYEDGFYYNKNDVSAYIYKFKRLPDNFVVKDDRGEVPSEDANKYMVGGDEFLNREQLIDNPNNYKMVECDVYSDGYTLLNRGSERLVFFANAERVFYTADHYGSFVLMTEFNINLVSYILFSVMGLIFVVMLICTIAAACIKKRNRIPLEEIVLSIEISAVIIVVFALSVPILLVKIVEVIHDGISDRRREAI